MPVCSVPSICKLSPCEEDKSVEEVKEQDLFFVDSKNLAAFQ